ncbi:nicotinate mononucleotide-dependent phosphoribosyltransferase CobT [Methanoregula sp.]|uniref:nicotinate mononucleotide-dependent phosphoribosyltransferase CobT n=1 Tax=Methanoregula sp. TaxID=2052170 RepID=UPI00356A17F1
MSFLSRLPDIAFTKPLFCGILGNTLLSTVPGISGAGPTPEGTLWTPVLDAELVTRGAITSFPMKPNTPTGCPTPASITRAMMELSGIRPLFINAGLRHPPTVPCFDVYGDVGGDPRFGEAVPRASDLFSRGVMMGEILSDMSDLLVLGECVPGGTTTALCVLRSLGYNAAVSSSFANNPVTLKEEICRVALERIRDAGLSTPLDIVRYAGDPMMPVAAGIVKSYTGNLLLAGGTQMLAVCAVIKAMGGTLPTVVTTAYVRDDPSANVPALADKMGVEMIYVDPDFGALGHSGLARYCIGEVKEGMGAGGAMCLAHLTGHSADEIRNKILTSVSAYS